MVDCLGIIIVTLSVLRPADSAVNCGQLEFEQPIVYKGESASLMYTPVDAIASLAWYKIEPEEPVLLYSNKTSKSSTKYTELKTDEGFILMISETELADVGYYAVICGAIWSPLAQLEVIVSGPTAPSYPEFLDVDDSYNCSKCLPARRNVRMNVTCFVKGGSEPVELNMFKSEELLSSVYRNKRTGSKTNTITYSFIPTNDDFDTVFKCTVKNPALQVEKSVTTKLYIKVDPESIDIKSKPTKENKTSNVECTTINVRPPSNPVFYLKNNLQSSVKITKTTQSGYRYNVTATLWKKLTRQDNKASVRCCSESSPDVCSNTEYLNVTFSPKSVVLSELSKVSEENGDTVLLLKCDVDESNPKSFVEWRGVEKIPGQFVEEKYINHIATHSWLYTTSWMFNLTKEDRRRKITCKVKNYEFPDLRLKQSYTPYITYSPVITISENGIKTVHIEDDVMLSCNVDSNPPSIITWYNETGKVEETTGANKLDLHLVNVTTEQSQTYTCTARNGIGGTKSRDVTLTVKVQLNPSEKSNNQPSNGVKSNTLVGAIIGGAVIISITIVATVVFFLCWKKRKDTSPKRVGTKQVKDEHRNESARPERKEPLYKNLLASNREVQNVTEYEFGDGTDHIDSEYERLQNQDDKRVYAELDLNFDSATGGIKLHNVIQPKTGTVKTDDDGVRRKKRMKGMTYDKTKKLDFF